MAPQVLTVAMCVCQGVTFSDFIMPLEILYGFNMADVPIMAPILGDVPFRVKIDILAPKMEPVAGIFPVPTINPTKTYEEALNTQYDILWVPAGPIPDPVLNLPFAPTEEIEFIRKQAPGAKYVLSVCGGSAILALAGVLNGKKATTNKSLFHNIIALVNATNPELKSQVTWVPKARWVVDGKIWTGSGVTAGNDMALAFVEHLVGPKLATIIRGQIEVVHRDDKDDPFAEFFKLV